MEETTSSKRDTTIPKVVVSETYVVIQRFFITKKLRTRGQRPFLDEKIWFQLRYNVFLTLGYEAIMCLSLYNSF